MFSGSAADMLKKYGQPVPEQQPMSSLEEAQAAKAKMEAEKAKDGHTHFHDGHACTMDHGHGEEDHNHSSGTHANECTEDHDHSEHSHESHGHKESGHDHGSSHDHSKCDGDHGHSDHGHKEESHGHGSSHDHAPAQKDFEGCAKGKYAWTDTGSTKAEDLGDAIRDYAFSDGNKKASVYVDLDGLDALADADLCVTKVSETRVEFTAQFPSGKRCLTLSPLHASIDEASLLRKPGKNRVILKLKKTKPEAWSTLLTAPPPAQPDPSAMGGLGGMDMESMMKSMAGMAGVPDPPDLGADDTGADPEEAGSDLDDLPDLEEDNVD
ncbi:unnamed protein product [Pelagomonas calceolata]|uniref:CS domain-containing protein n=1 Tax=Pelagomonas calceolata TaxID=35677 RepID=A0A8J2SIL5_9STRA|nr:unnamed protein product [Pelagomonas calceolata]